MSYPGPDEHERFLERMSAALDAPSSPDEEAWLQAHRSACASCARAADEMAGDAAALRSLPRAPMPAPLRQAILSRARGQAAPSSAPWFLSRWALAPAAAAALIVLAWIAAPVAPPPGDAPAYDRLAERAPSEPKEAAPPVTHAAPPAPLEAPKADAVAKLAAQPPSPQAKLRSKDPGRRDAPASEFAPAPGSAIASLPRLPGSEPALPVATRFRATLARAGEPFTLGPLEPIRSATDPALPSRRLLAADRLEALGRTLDEGKEESSAAGDAAPRAAAAPSVAAPSAAAPPAAFHQSAAKPPHRLQLLVRVDPEGRIVEAQAVGAQTAPYDLTQSILRWLVGQAIVPHDPAEPPVIALEIDIPAE